MKISMTTVCVALTLTSCTATTYQAQPGIEPIPGSITYGGQPRTKLRKSPVGSTFHNYFYGPFGEHIEETYIILPDRSIKLIDRRTGFIGFPDN